MSIDIISKIQTGTPPDTNATQLFLMDVEKFLDALPQQPLFDLVVTSPPYNIGKEYETQKPLTDYVAWQRRIIEKIYPRLKDNGSICWQVGNYVENGSITPLDIELAPIFKDLNLHLRNRIIWHFGHGLHNKNRFSGRYEVVMWYTKTDTYMFFMTAIIGIVCKIYYRPNVINQITTSVMSEQKLEVVAQHDIDHPIFHLDLEKKEQFFTLFEYCYTKFYRPGYEFLKTFKEKYNNYSNFTKINNNYTTYVFKQIEFEYRHGIPDNDMNLLDSINNCVARLLSRR